MKFATGGNQAAEDYQGVKDILSQQNIFKTIISCKADKAIFGEWNSAFFTVSLIVEGTTEKVSQFIMPLVSIYDKMLCLNEQKCIFEHCMKIKPIKIYL